MRYAPPNDKHLIRKDGVFCCFIYDGESNPRGSADKKKRAVHGFSRRAVKSGTEEVSLGSTSHKYAKQTVDYIRKSRKNFFLTKTILRDTMYYAMGGMVWIFS